MRFPKLRAKYDTSRIWQSLPTDAELEARNKAEEVTDDKLHFYGISPKYFEIFISIFNSFESKLFHVLEEPENNCFI